MTEATRLAERADKCAKYGFDSVEMVEVKWALWDEIIAALRAMPQERPSDAYAGPVVTHDMMAWYPPSKALESLAPSPASAREEKREFIGVMNAILLVENGCNDEAAKRFADTFAEKCSENAKLIARVAKLEKALEHITELLVDTWRHPMAGDPENEIAVMNARAALAPSAQEGETVAVPKAALEWLFGSQPDADGKWFGECREAISAMEAKFPRRFWWRSKFRSMIPALSRPERGSGLAGNINKCPSCQRMFVDGETCSRGGCPMGGDF